MREKLERIQVGNERLFFESLPDILRSIDQEQLIRIFQGWMPRAQEASQSNGDYVISQIIFVDIGYVQFHHTGLAHVLIDQTIVFFPIHRPLLGIASLHFAAPRTHDQLVVVICHNGIKKNA
jgi:hypothetical protein